MYLGWIIAIIGLGIATALGVPVIVAENKIIKGVSERWDYSSHYTAGGMAMMIIAILMCIMSGVSLLVSVIVRPITKSRYLGYLETSQMIEQVLDNGSDYENLMITDTIIEYNKGIAYAKASQKAFGIASIWYGYDLDKLEYVRVNSVVKEQD